MKKLLQINVEANFGSTGRIAEDIGKLVSKEGWESYIAFGRKQRQSSSSLIPIGNKTDHLVHVAHTRILDRHGLASRNSTKTFVEKIKQINPSIVHLHNIHGYYLNYEVLFTFLASTSIPVVWTLHDCWPLTGHCTHFVDVGCEKWESECHQCPQLEVYPQSWLRDRSRKNQLQKKTAFSTLNNLTIVPVSEWLAGVVQKSYLSNYPNKTISNGIDTSIFCPKPKKTIRKKYDLKNKFVVLGVASVWSTKKGLNDFILLSKLLKENEIIVLIGLNKNQLKLLPKNIIGIERTDSVTELADWYSAADVYANTSVEESFGLTTAEALACGTPIIVYNTTASPEMVVEEVGFVTNRRDISMLYRNVCKIKEIGKEYFTEACRERAINLYDKDKTFAQYVKLYHTLLDNV